MGENFSGLQTFLAVSQTSIDFEFESSTVISVYVFVYLFGVARLRRIYVNLILPYSC